MKLFMLKIDKTTFSVIASVMFISGILFMSSCKKPGDTFQKFDASNLRVVNGMFGPTDVKFFLDTFNLTLNTSLNFREVSTPEYYVVESGLRTAKFFSTVTNDFFAVKDIQLDPKKNYTLFLGGNVNGPKFWLTEDELIPAPTDKTKLRLGNLAITGGNIDVTIQIEDTTTLPQPKPEVVVFSNASSESISDYTLATVPVSKGNSIKQLHTIRIYEAGTTNVLLTAPAIDLRGTSIHTIILTGVSGGTPALGLNVEMEWLDW